MLILFLRKMQAFRPATLLKRDSKTDVFKRILRNFLERLYLQNTSAGCFWKCDILLKLTHFTALFHFYISAISGKKQRLYGTMTRNRLINLWNSNNYLANIYLFKVSNKNNIKGVKYIQS